MNFFEEELKKVLQEEDKKKFIGRNGYIRLPKDRLLKLEFISPEVRNEYRALKLMVLNSNGTTIDTALIYFSDLFGKKRVNNPNFEDGIYPYIWENENKAEWYVYKPNEEDYKQISKAINSYISLYKCEIATISSQEELSEMDKNQAMLGEDLPEVIKEFVNLEDSINGCYHSFGEWVRIAYELNQDFCITLKEQAEDICNAFYNVKDKYGNKIAKKIYDSRDVVLPHEIENVADFLNKGLKEDMLKGLAEYGYLSDFHRYTEDDKWNIIRFLNSGGDIEELDDVIHKKQQGMQM